jgi:hypothetical protein
LAKVLIIGIAIELESQRPRLMVSADLAIPLEKLDQLLIFAWLSFDPEHDSEHEGLLCSLLAYSVRRLRGDASNA